MCWQSRQTAGSDIGTFFSSSSWALRSFSAVILDSIQVLCSKFFHSICRWADPRTWWHCKIPKATNGNVSCFRNQQSWYLSTHLIWSLKLTLTSQSLSSPPSPNGNRQGKAFSKKFNCRFWVVSDSVPGHGRPKSVTGCCPCHTAYPPSLPSFHRFARPHAMSSLAVSIDMFVSIAPETCKGTMSGPGYMTEVSNQLSTSTWWSYHLLLSRQCLGCCHCSVGETRKWF